MNTSLPLSVRSRMFLCSRYGKLFLPIAGFLLVICFSPFTGGHFSAFGLCALLGWLLILSPNFFTSTPEEIEEEYRATLMMEEPTFPVKLTSSTTQEMPWLSISEDGELNLSQLYRSSDYMLRKIPRQLIIPERLDGVTVRSIAPGAFHNTDIFLLVLPDSVETIGDNAFSGCNHLYAAQLPKHLNKLGHDVFSFTGLRWIEIPGSVKLIPDSAFAHCYSINTIVIQEGVERIDHGAFSLSCTSRHPVAAMYLPKSVKRIENTAFLGARFGSVFYDGSKRSWKRLTHKIFSSRKVIFTEF